MCTFRKTRLSILDSFHDGDISEDEFFLLYDLYTSRNPDFPYDCYRKFNLEDIDESECLPEFRFRKSDIPLLADVLGLPDSYTCHQGTVCDGIEGPCLLLKRFAYPCRYSDLISRFGRPVPELSMISTLVMNTIYDITE